MQYVIIDESGRFGDPSNRFLIFASVCANSLIGLDKIIPKARKKVPTKGKRKLEKTLAEIKFSSAGGKTRKEVLKLISKQDLEIFLLVVETQGRKVEDNPENYALLVSEILSMVVKKNPNLKHVVIDRHFTWIHQREKFNELLQVILKKDLFIEHLDSQQNTIVSLADFVAGGVRDFYSKGSEGWKKIIEDKIVREEKISWRKLRQQKR